MYAERHAVSLTTDASGDVTGYTPVVSGRVLAVQYVKNDFDNGADFAITGETSGLAILTLTDQNSSATFYPRAGVCGPTGTALTYDGTRTVNEPVVVAGERVKVVVAQGGNAKSGTVYVVIG